LLQCNESLLAPRDADQTGASTVAFEVLRRPGGALRQGAMVFMTPRRLLPGWHFALQRGPDSMLANPVWWRSTAMHNRDT
jgi:hypothetical protein